MNYDKGHLLNMYDSIQEKRKQRDEYIKKVQELDSEIEKDLLQYRLDSVNRVLDYMHTKSFTSGKRFNTLITHCCNKINGNIDGIELNLEKDVAEWGTIEEFIHGEKNE